jgi:hypothetical protein
MHGHTQQPKKKKKNLKIITPNPRPHQTTKKKKKKTFAKLINNYEMEPRPWSIRPQIELPQNPLKPWCQDRCRGGLPFQVHNQEIYNSKENTNNYFENSLPSHLFSEWSQSFSQVVSDAWRMPHRGMAAPECMPPPLPRIQINCT